MHTFLPVLGSKPKEQLSRSWDFLKIIFFVIKYCTQCASHWQQKQKERKDFYIHFNFLINNRVFKPNWLIFWQFFKVVRISCFSCSKYFFFAFSRFSLIGQNSKPTYWPFEINLNQISGYINLTISNTGPVRNWN